MRRHNTAWLSRSRTLVAAFVIFAFGTFEPVSADPNIPEQSLGPLDYIIITHNDFLGQTGFEDLLSYFTLQGKEYLIFDIDDGVHRDSVRQIVRNMYDSTDYAPTYLLLVGSARSGGTEETADASAMNFIPTFYRNSVFGNWTAYDQWFGLLSDYDEMVETPSIVVGRIPARSDADIQAYVDKLEEYAIAPYGAWKEHVFFVAGDRDRGPFGEKPQPQVVNNETNALIDSLSQGMTNTVLRYSDHSTYNEREQEFISAIDAGAGIMVTLSTYANANEVTGIVERQYFDASTDLGNSGKYLVHLAASCNLGQTESSTSLCRDFLFAPSRGAIAWVGPAGYSSDLSNYPFVAEALSSLLRRGVRRIGDLTTSSILRLRKSGRGVYDTHFMTTLLGDPGLVVDLGNGTANLTEFYGTMELTEASPLIYSQPFTESGLAFARAGVIKENALVGKRAYALDGRLDPSDPSPLKYWTLYENLGVPIGPDSRFLTYRIKATEHCDDPARFGVDLVLEGGSLLSECLLCIPPISDQYGTPLDISARQVPLGEAQLYAFDLESVFEDGLIITDIVIGHDASTVANGDTFSVIFDNIELTATWGAPPEIGEIEMLTNILVSTTEDAFIDAEDYDVATRGDVLTYEWLAPVGEFVGDGAQVVYHAPDVAIDGIDVKVIVSDKGGHADTATKTINIVNAPPSGCPHLYVWDGREYIDQGAVLTRSTFETEKVTVVDNLPFFTKPAVENGLIRLMLREDGHDVTDLEKVTLGLVKLDRAQEGRHGITADGRVLRLSNPIPPTSCADDHLFSQMDKVSAADGNVYHAYGPGHLILFYEGLLSTGLAKPGASFAEGGGTALEPPPKNVAKIVAEYTLPDVPNYLTLSVSTGSGSWEEIERLPARSWPRLPGLIDLAPYVKADGSLLIKISWTWSFAADDLSFYKFDQAGVSRRESALTFSTHNIRGPNTPVLRYADGDQATIAPGEDILLEFAVDSTLEFDFGVIKLWGKYEPAADRALVQDESPSIDEVGEELVLSQNSPNPFNSGTVIKFDLPRTGRARVLVYNILGAQIAIIQDGVLPSGQHSCAWNGRDSRGVIVATGVYFYTLEFENKVSSRKMVLVK